MSERWSLWQFALVAFLAALIHAERAEASTAPPRPAEAGAVLLPIPASIEQLAGLYRPAERITVVLPERPGAELRELGAHAADMLGKAWGRRARLVTGAAPRQSVRLALAPEGGADPEAYRLLVSPAGIDLTAPTPTGLFYGLQTLRQLAEQGSDAGIAAVRISDAPRFRWRGLHLDVARHMMPIDYIKRQLDLMARYKFNRFHWHLTDDQGWRLEIKRYPRLTSVGAWREETVLERKLDPYVGDGKPYGGFYTQEQVREIVAYAKARHIEVIPEIDIPGHTVAVLAAYPELACTPGPFKVRTTWGVAEDILCPSEASLTFVKNVMLEVMELFPSSYIHLGGDEAPTVRWEKSPLAQSIIRREGLADEHALQGWFLRHIEEFLNARGRRIIGWDEILDGKPMPSATVMSWRGMNYGVVAARSGHDVIMSPTSHAYFDYCQGKIEDEPICNGQYLPLSQVYAFEPVPPELTAQESARVLGGQGNVWTEYLKTPEAVEYMLWPRGLAMAEVLWSPRELRNWDRFGVRLAPQLALFDRLDVNYRIPEVEGLESDVLSLQPTAALQLRTILPNAVIRYTLDGSTPGPQSPIYRGPVTLPLTTAGTLVKARPFVGDRAGPVTSARYRFTRLKPAITAPKPLKPGLDRRYFEAPGVDKVARLEELEPVRRDVVAQVAIPGYARELEFGLAFDGFVRVPADGIYTFALHSDDGSALWIGDEQVVNRDGYQSPGETKGSVALAAGLHKVALRYFQSGGGSALRVMVTRNGETPREVPQNWWLRP